MSTVASSSQLATAEPRRPWAVSRSKRLLGFGRILAFAIAAFSFSRDMFAKETTAFSKTSGLSATLSLNNTFKALEPYTSVAKPAVLSFSSKMRIPVFYS